jgi:Biotin-protein ligase, N terminal
MLLIPARRDGGSQNLGSDQRVALLALFHHEPYCSRACGDGVVAALSQHHTIETITRHELEPDILARFDMVIFPGGHGASDAFRTLLKSRTPVIRNYVAQGGAYLGICMGAYWADKAYFDLAGGLRCGRYIERPNAEIRRSFATVARTQWRGQSEKMFFFDGCAFTGDHASWTIDATYANGEPMAVRRGRVGLVGCHPESGKDWYKTKAMAPFWHGGRHHRLLAGFVEDLLETPRETENAPSTGESIEEIKRLKATLAAIEEATRPFTQGTLKRVNDMARKTLGK